ncbi:MAG: hypothetical protein NTZ56_22770 [Acidobacteria bacterium]|nr:hypothetical protein [Acidobacteriota bacterium]
MPLADLDVRNKILYSSIAGLKKIPTAQRPVFLLVGWRGDKVVVKHETSPSVDASVVKFSNTVMRAVDPAVKIVPLDPQEVTEIRDWIADRLQEVADNLRVGIADQAKPDELYFNQMMNAPGQWTKMAPEQGFTSLDDAHNAFQAAHRDKGPVKKFAAALNAPGGLEALGAIVVADAFSGNSDRFHPGIWDSTGGYMTGANGNYKALVNIGNVILTEDGNGKLRPIGLDPIETGASIQTQLNSTLAVLDPNNEWAGYILASTAVAQARLRGYAEMIVDDLNLALGARSRRLPGLRKQRLEQNAAIRLLNGMNTAKLQLAQKLRDRVTSGKATPQLILDKMNALAW